MQELMRLQKGESFVTPRTSPRPAGSCADTASQRALIRPGTPSPELAHLHRGFGPGPGGKNQRLRRPRDHSRSGAGSRFRSRRWRAAGDADRPDRNDRKSDSGGGGPKRRRPDFRADFAAKRDQPYQRTQRSQREAQGQQIPDRRRADHRHRRRRGCRRRRGSAALRLVEHERYSDSDSADGDAKPGGARGRAKLQLLDHGAANPKIFRARRRFRSPEK